MMLSFHHIFKTWQNKVSGYIALTDFMKQKYIEGGFPAHKIAVRPLYIHPDPGYKQGEKKYALYAGRLTVEKGLPFLLNAWKHLDEKIPLKIIGDGKLRDYVIEESSQMDEVEYHDWTSHEELLKLIAEARFFIFPSQWYEGFGRVILEAFLRRVPLIATDLGATGNIIEHRRTRKRWK